MAFNGRAFGLILASIALLGLCVAAEKALGQTQGVPKLLIEHLSYDFKEVKEGQVLERSFVLQNRGTAPLQIKKVRPG